MRHENILLVINPGSTSTKVAVAFDDEIAFEKTLHHSEKELANFERVNDQLLFRKEIVKGFLDEIAIAPKSLNCVVARGGLVKPIAGGTYLVNEVMCQDIENSTKEHASNLGALLAREFTKATGIFAFIVDPIVVDEMEPIAKVSGLNGVERKSIFHALNQKAVARKAAALQNKRYEECNLIVAHMGGGISVGAHQQGRVIDVNNAVDGDGPFSPERSGGVPVCSVMDMCYAGDITPQIARRLITGRGGLISYLGTNDGRLVEAMIREGNEEAHLVYGAMAYQTAKEIGSCAAVLKGKIDAIVLTGGLVYSELLVNWIKERVDFMAPILLFPGEKEMEALIQGALRVLRGEEQYKIYE